MNPTTQAAISGSFFPEASIIYRNGASSNADATSFTFTGSVSTESPDRVVVVCVISNGADATSVTVGGVAATQLVDGGISEVWAARCPTGTAVTIQVLLASAFVRMGAFCFSAYNVINEKIPLATATGSQTRPTDLSRNVIRGSIGAAASYNNDSTGFTWSGITENYDAYVSGGSFTVASQNFSLNETPRAMSVICGDASPVGFQSALAVIR